MRAQINICYAVIFLVVTSLSGCTTGKMPNPVKPLLGPPVQSTKTPYTDVLVCVGKHVKRPKSISIAVDQIPDRTGKFSVYDGGYKVTQGAEDMAVSAIGMTNAFVQVERQNLNIPVFELKYSDQYLLKDLNPNENIRDKSGKIGRAIKSGAFIGSDYVLTGSITEINYNLDSGGFELSIDGIGGGWRSFWFDVGLDLRVVDTKTGQIVMTIPERKQLWGYQNKAGIVRFFGNTFTDFNAGKRVEEPIGLAVRSVIENAVINMTKKLYRLPQGTCEQVRQAVEGGFNAPTNSFRS